MERRLNVGAEFVNGARHTVKSSEVACYESIRNNSGCCRRRIFGRSAILLRPILGRGVVDAAPNRSLVRLALRRACTVRITKRKRPQPGASSAGAAPPLERRYPRRRIIPIGKKWQFRCATGPQVDGPWRSWRDLKPRAGAVLFLILWRGLNIEWRPDGVIVSPTP